MGARRTGRTIAFQTLYRYDLTGQSLEELMDFSWIESARLTQLKSDSLDFAKLLVAGTVEKIEDVDRAIVGQLENWDFSRLAKVDLAILRMSAYCLLYQAAIPQTVTIDEAVMIAKKYGSTDSFKFVNGVLDGLRRNLIGG